jgi:cell wall-associated NlpC family hydrolase
VLASGCSSLKQSSARQAENNSRDKTTVVNKNPKFLDNISINPGPETRGSNEKSRKNAKSAKIQNDNSSASAIEKASSLQFKYALLLNVDVEELQNPGIYRFIDDWYGTRYCMGGTTKTCIDCSAFVQTFFSSIYGLNIPRTAKDQYDAANKIPTAKLKQGDLLFFNTRGGISHVGVYLQNNKFVHASTTGGVMISDMFETYYIKHFIGAGRVGNMM